MGRIGRKFAADIYPQSPNSGGGGANALVPLSRQRFIDGDTTQTGLNGSVANPYKTIAQFMAARAANNTSIPNATANFVGWVMPSVAGYVEDVAFPPYATTELRADSVSIVAGTIVTGNVTWPNIAGPFVASVATAAMHNISVTGNITLTDDVGAPSSFFLFSGDEAGDSAPIIRGNFVSSTTQNLFTAVFVSCSVQGDINTGDQANSAPVTIYEAVVIGDITTRFLFAQDSTINSDEINCFSATQASQFVNCTFTGAGTDLNCDAVPTGAIFDGPSWNSFISQGGTRDVGTTILVVGGYSAGSIEGAALTGAATSVSLNGVGATAGYTLENSGNHYSTSNGTPTSVTLLTGGGELPGDTICITKTDGANAIAVINGGAGAGTIGTIPANERGFVIGKFDGTNWIFFEGGSLAA